MKILLDLSQSKISKLTLFENEKKLDQLTGAEPLLLLDQMLKKHDLALTDLEEISSFPGPGSFTGLKIAASIVNTLNWQLGRPGQVVPKYD